MVGSPRLGAAWESFTEAGAILSQDDMDRELHGD